MEFLNPKFGDSKKNIATRVLHILVDADSSMDKYNNAIEDFNELGGLSGIAKIMEWDESQKSNWSRKIQNIYSIK
jgi:hypothetical protein